MAVDYSNLWKILVDRKISRTEFRNMAHISTNAVAKLGRNEYVSLEMLSKIATALECPIEDIVTIIPEKKSVLKSQKKVDYEKAGTFSLNKGEPIHRWYSYVEGYSSILIDNEIDRILSQGEQITAIYDPFSGTGTTNLVASMKGIESFYSETNPFMQNVIETKINSVFAFNKRYSINVLLEYLDKVNNTPIKEIKTWDGFEKYYDQPQLSQMLTIKSIIDTETNTTISSLLRLALSAIAIKSSKMIRRGDLRYATEKEYHKINVIEAFSEKLCEIIEDIDSHGDMVKCQTIKVSDDARENNYSNKFDCVITSPPYLNGTNYIRNTKLELKLNGLIETENDLPSLHTKGIVSGINNVSGRTKEITILSEVQKYYDMLLESKYDARIPTMVAKYFYDMNDVFKKLNKSMKNNGHLIMDIGDSQFGGVYIPTHEILILLGKNNGFSLESQEILRERHSKDGTALTQRLLRFRLEK